MKKFVSKSLGVGLGLVFICAVGVPHSAVAGDGEYEGVAHCVEEYGSSGECPGDDTWYTCCQGNTWWGRFDDAFNDNYNYTQVVLHDDKKVDSIDWKDSESDENDPYGTDFADVVLFVGHGAHECEDGDYFTEFRMGDSSYDCYVGLGDANYNELGWANNRATGGIGDTNILLARACNGAQRCVWDDNRFNPMRKSNEFNTFNSFHGTHYAAWEDSINFRDYLDMAENNYVSTNWVGNLTDSVVGGKNCAVSVLFGADADELSLLFIQQGFKDFKSVGSGAYGYGHVDGCNPDDGPPL